MSIGKVKEHKMAKSNRAEKYASSGAAGKAPVPKPTPKLTAQKPKQPKKPVQKSNKPKSNKPKLKQKEPEIEPDFTMIYAGAGSLILLSIFISVYLLTPPAIDQHEQAMFEASIYVKSIDHVPVHYSQTYQDSEHDDTILFLDEITVRVNGSFQQNGFSTTKVQINGLKPTSSSVLEERLGERHGESRFLDDLAGVSVSFTVFGDVKSNLRTESET